MGENGENEEEEDIEENNEGTAPDEGAQVIVDLRNNRGSAYNGAIVQNYKIPAGGQRMVSGKQGISM